MITPCHIPSLIGWHWKSRMEYLLYQTNVSLSCHVICLLSCHGSDDTTMRHTQLDLYHWGMDSVLWLNGVIACSCARRRGRHKVSDLIRTLEVIRNSWQLTAKRGKWASNDLVAALHWPLCPPALGGLLGVQPVLMSALSKPWLDGLCETWNINRVAQQGHSPTKITPNTKWNGMFYSWN